MLAMTSRLQSELERLPGRFCEHGLQSHYDVEEVHHFGKLLLLHGTIPGRRIREELYEFSRYLAGACEVVYRCCAAMDKGVSLSADAVRPGIAMRQYSEWTVQHSIYPDATGLRAVLRASLSRTVPHVFEAFGWMSELDT